MTTTTPSQHRTREEWDELAEDVLPYIREYGLTDELRKDRDIGYSYPMKMALAKKGYTIRGKELKLHPISVKRPDAVAKQIAERRANKVPYWQLEVESGMTYGAMRRLCEKHGWDFATGKELSSNGN